MAYRSIERGEPFATYPAADEGQMLAVNDDKEHSLNLNFMQGRIYREANED